MPQSHVRALVIALVVAVVAAGIFGWLFGDSAKEVAWIGELFLNALRMTIVPLVVAAVVTGITSVGDIRAVGRFGGVTLGYYATTTMIAVLIGLALVNWVQPGAGVGEVADSVPEAIASREETGVADIARMLVAPNLLEQAAQNQLLPLIVFSIFFAVALTTLGERGLRVVEFLDGVNEAMMRIVGWIMYFAPVGIFALVAARLGEAGGGAGFIAEVRGVALYVVTVSTGLAIHFVVLLAILFLFARRGVAFVASMLRALMTALGTSSSAATLPVTMECARESGIDERAVRLVIPVGCTVNMDGTALYEAVAAMFIAQAYGIELSVGQQAVVFVTATLAAVGAAGVPAGGLVTLVIVLNAVKLPLEGIGLILAVDWFVNRLRAAVNVWGDAVGAAILDRLLKSDRAGA